MDSKEVSDTKGATNNGNLAVKPASLVFHANYTLARSNSLVNTAKQKALDYFETFLDVNYKVTLSKVLESLANLVKVLLVGQKHIFTYINVYNFYTKVQMPKDGYLSKNQYFSSQVTYTQSLNIAINNLLSNCMIKGTTPIETILTALSTTKNTKYSTEITWFISQVEHIALEYMYSQYGWTNRNKTQTDAFLNTYSTDVLADVRLLFADILYEFDKLNRSDAVSEQKLKAYIAEYQKSVDNGLVKYIIGFVFIFQKEIDKEYQLIEDTTGLYLPTLSFTLNNAISVIDELLYELTLCYDSYYDTTPIKKILTTIKTGISNELSGEPMNNREKYKRLSILAESEIKILTEYTASTALAAT
jgi:hypothetical protein